MTDTTLQINSQEEVAFKLYKDVVYAESQLQGLSKKQHTKEELLKLSAQCLQVVKGIPADRALA